MGLPKRVLAQSGGKTVAKHRTRTPSERPDHKIVIDNSKYTFVHVRYRPEYFDLNPHDHVVWFEADLFHEGETLIRDAVTGGAGDDAGVAGWFQTKDLVELLRLETFHRAGVDTHDGRTRDELSQRDVDLVRLPRVEPALGAGLVEVADCHLPKLGQRFRRAAAHLHHSGHMPIHMLRVEVATDREHHEVRAFHDLHLMPGGGHELFLHGRIGDDVKLPRLEANGGWSQHERLLQRMPVLRRNLARGIELARGVTPVESFEKLLR
jgi:hypothetical protein